MAWFTNPAVISGAASVAGGIYKAFSPDEQKQIMLDVLADMRGNRQKLLRQSRGKFTGQERDEIRQAAEPGLNQLAGNIAQRGLGTSGAGAQVMAQAQVQPYAQARTAAGEQLIQQDAALADIATYFPPDDSFFDDLGATVQAFYTYKGLRGLEKDAPDDEDDIFRGMLQSILTLGEKYKQFMAGAQYQRSLTGE